MAKAANSAADPPFENSAEGRKHLTDHICYALAAAADAIRQARQAVGFEAHGLSGPTVDVAESVVAMLHRVGECLVASNALAQAEVVELFRGHYASPPEPIAGVSGASYHEIGRAIAFRVETGCWFAADPLAAREAFKPDGTGQRFDESLIARNWLSKKWISEGQTIEVNGGVRDWLANIAPTFDAHDLIAKIQDEATRANRLSYDASPADGLLSTRELAALAGVTPKGFINAHYEARKLADKSKRPPTPSDPSKGSRPASFSYTAIRPWLCSNWEGRMAYFPGSADEARSLAQELLGDG